MRGRKTTDGHHIREAKLIRMAAAANAMKKKKNPQITRRSTPAAWTRSRQERAREGREHSGGNGGAHLMHCDGDKWEKATSRKGTSGNIAKGERVCHAEATQEASPHASVRRMEPTYQRQSAWVSCGAPVPSDRQSDSQGFLGDVARFFVRNLLLL
jgi:hypothetical protein